jgi:hypothetical protein
MRKPENSNPVQEGYAYLAYYDTINPATGEKWTIKEIGRAVKKKYGYVRNRLGLVTKMPLGGKESRRLTLEQVERLFDATPEDDHERLRAFAECMDISLEQAIDESRHRRGVHS